MTSSWPIGVTTEEDMHQDAKTLFGDCTIENLLTGTPFDADPQCFLIRVKDACNHSSWRKWPELIDDAMKDIVDTYGRADVVQAKSKRAGASRARIYDTLQVTPSTCTCRVCFGGDGHHKIQTGASATKATRKMAKMLMAKFEPTEKHWDEETDGYHTKAFHLVLNKYHRNDIIDPQQDLSTTYGGRNPIASLSFGQTGEAARDDRRCKDLGVPNPSQ